MKYIWDTNTAIYFLQQTFPGNVEEFIDVSLDESLVAISAITEIELLCWKNATETDLNLISGFIKDCVLIELENAVKLKTIEIRRDYRVKLPDAIIAATAIVYNLTLITYNERDFKNIAELNFINPGVE